MLTMDPEVVNKGAPTLLRELAVVHVERREKIQQRGKKESQVLKHRTLHPAEK